MSFSNRAKELTAELTSNPFFPLLFIGKAAETSTFHTVGEASINTVGASFAMAIVSIFLWVYAYKEVQWGISKAEDAVEEVNE